MGFTEMMNGNLPRKMRRDDCRMPLEAVEQYLRTETWGVLSVHGDNGFPYGVPMNYVWENGTVLLHATSENSHRLDALERDNRVCFTVVPEHTLDRDRWTTVYRSIIVFGTAEIIRSPEEIFAAMRSFMGQLAPHKTEEAFHSCDPKSAKMVMIRIRPVMVTGKQST